ncbi:Rpn family recombination-promoting nuclease/putative transposase [Flammeovirga kamogawensis]|uniref:Rpn family recombination-promoting nuclease/putative transposase n=1 Tax=Flammeovirga kamogawensis TaxID=373891 RepID=A0ABX8H4N8_9BACT|nr:Rpn family recombination-promoting nuclease/putative transposase [Flammeovirga kamogawensis]MBB6461782.1 putative transposase/invertase (TIGR01784 family) [Flammeovirga kamogawensis]QWG10698.1 Rpn family recombination-promoting nuclease/putative transposase [Flammeovirga kamogawensis]TRX63800.1 Rpn family recombination-promoting nuclease/putative transposase [Flammeovirga kamogawensis]
MKNNLIRFDWAIKRLLRNKAYHVILEGFLSELMQEDLTIDSILESEGNQESASDKFNRVDILVKNQKGEYVIIEVQNQLEFNYFQRMLYGTSKVLTEYIKVGEPYHNVKKVYSVNIVYFDLGQGADYVYHGKTNFEGIYQHDNLELSGKQKVFLGEDKTPSDLFPEYYIIKVNQFDDVARNTLDEWIYYFKNNEIKDEFKAKGLEQAKEILKVDKMTKSEQASYKNHIVNLMEEASRERTLEMEAIIKEREIGKEEGKEIGKEEGKKEQAIETAKSMLQDGLDIEKVALYSGLTIEEVEALTKR